jgi:hypothetical protein
MAEIADRSRPALIGPQRPHAQTIQRFIARLHSRGKDNEMRSKGLRAPVDEDAEFALEALGFVLRELEWAAG